MELHELADGFKAVEQAVASIYRSFMDLFPEERRFWQELYRDELEHAFWLSGPDHVEAIDLLPSRELLPTEETLLNTLKTIEREHVLIKSNPVSLEEALKIALKLEDLMIEVFTNELPAHIFASDYKSLSDRISAAERLHINKIEDLMINKGFLQLS